MASTDKLIRIILKVNDQASKGFQKAADSAKSMGAQMKALAGYSYNEQAGRWVDDLTGRFVTAEEALGRTKTKLQAFSDKLVSVGGSMQRFGSQLTASVTLPLVAAGTAGVKMAMDLDETMRNIQSVGKQTDAEIAALSDTFVEMSTDITKTTDSAQSLAEAFYDIQGSGFEGADAMKVLEAATMAATAGLTDTHTAAKGITAVLNAYGASAEESAHASDLMFATVDRGVGSFEELVSAMSNVTPTASAMNIPFSEISAAVATMSKQGFTFSEATVNLNQALTSLLKPSEAMKKALTEMGYASGQALIDAKGLDGAMQALSEHTGGSTEKMAALFGNVRAMRAAFSLTGDGAKMFSEDLEAMANATGRTAEAFATQTQSFAAQWKNFQNVLSALLIEVGQTLIPILSDLLQNYIIPAIQWFRQLPEPVKQGVIAFAALAAVLGPILMFIGGIISAIGTIGGAISGLMTIFSTIGTAVAALAPAFGAIGAALAAISAPVWIVIAAITALVAVIALLWMNREKIGQWAQSVWDGMKKAGQSIKETGQNLAKDLWAKFEELFPKTAEAMKALGQSFKEIGIAIIKGLAEGVRSQIDSFLKMVVDFANKVANSVKSALKIKSPSQVFAGIGEQVVAGFNKGLDSMGGLGVNVNGTNIGSGSSTPSIATGGAGGGSGVYIQNLYLQPTTANIYDEINRKLAKDAKRKGANDI